MTTRELREQLEKEIKALQELCHHSETSWMDQCWAPAHSTGNQVLVCRCCEKILETKVSTWTPCEMVDVDLGPGL